MEYWPQIIAEAAKSPLGILALMVLAVSALALAFFRNAHVGIRLSVFVLMLAGVFAFGYKATLVASEGPGKVAPREGEGSNGAGSTSVSAVDYNRIQEAYVRAKHSKDCREIRSLLARIETFGNNTHLVPAKARYSVRYPYEVDEPTIADLSRDRAIRIRKVKSSCFPQHN